MRQYIRKHGRPLLPWFGRGGVVITPPNQYRLQVSRPPRDEKMDTSHCVPKPSNPDLLCPPPSGQPTMPSVLVTLQGEMLDTSADRVPMPARPDMLCPPLPDPHSVTNQDKELVTSDCNPKSAFSANSLPTPEVSPVASRPPHKPTRRRDRTVLPVNQNATRPRRLHATERQRFYSSSASTKVAPKK